MTKNETKARGAVSPVKNLPDERWLHFQYNYVEWFTSHLINLLPYFDGDLTEMLILAIIGQVHLKRYQDAQKTDAAFNADEIFITASRLADITKLSRETIRRKLKKLEARGWIEKNPDASWRLYVDADGAKVHRDLKMLTAETVTGLQRLIKVLSETAPEEP